MSDLSGDYLELVGALPARLLALAEAIEARGEPRGGANPTWLKRWIYPDPGRTLRPLIRLTVWLWQFLDRLGYFVFWFAIGALGFMLGLWLLIGAAIALLYALGWLPPL